MAGDDHPNLAETKAIVIAVAAGVAFGTLAIFAKLAYRKGAEFLPLLAGRFAVATVLLMGFAIASKRSLVLPRKRLLALISLGALGYAFEASLFFAALERAPAAVVGLIFYSYPMWTVLLGLALKIDVFNGKVLGALALGSAGIAIIFTLPKVAPEGMFFALGAAVAVAVYFTLVQLAVKDVDPVVGAAWTTAGAAFALVLLSAITRKGVPLEAAPELAGLGVASAVAFALMYRAIVVIGSSRASIVMMVEPVATLVLAALLLGEKITPRVIVGAIVIVAALPVLTRKGPPPEPI